MPPRRKTWADIMSDDESNEEDGMGFLAEKRDFLNEDACANLVTEDTYQGPQHADAEQSRLGLNAALDAMDCSNAESQKGDDDGFFTPYKKKRRPAREEDVHTGAPKNPRESPKAKVPKLEGQKTATGRKEPPPAPARPDFDTASKAALAAMAGKGKGAGKGAPPTEKAAPTPAKPPTRAPWAAKDSSAAANEVPMQEANAAPPAKDEKTDPEPQGEAAGSSDGALELAAVQPVELRSLEEVGPERAAAAQAQVDWERRREQRQKQIDIGYNTVGYQRYKDQLHRGGPNPADPLTPRADSRKDRKDWNLELKVWRTFLHKFDPPDAETPASAENA